MMSKSKRQRGKGGEGRHIRLYHYMCKSPAWKSLNGNERATYLLLAERYNGSNNGTIPYSVREVAADLRISQQTACRCLQALQERGFIVAMMKGAFSLKVHHATEWRLTEHVCNKSGHGPTSEYRDWRPDQKIQNPISLRNPYGFSGETDGFSGETVLYQDTRHGFPGETVNGQKRDPQSHQGSTYSLPATPSLKGRTFVQTGTLVRTEGAGRSLQGSSSVRAPAAHAAGGAGSSPAPVTKHPGPGQLRTQAAKLNARAREASSRRTS